MQILNLLLNIMVDMAKYLVDDKSPIRKSIAIVVLLDSCLENVDCHDRVVSEE